MPHAITPAMTFDTIEDSIIFTRAALRADPDAQDLLPVTDAWLALLEPARAKDRACREAVANANAARVIANGRLDAACGAFADDLFLAAGKDRHAARWTQFFSSTITSFTRQALSKQVTTVLGWLTGSKDPALEPRRADLDKWANAANDALVKTRATALVRGEAHLSREELADALTRERDGLHETLAARARDKRLPRDWADLFFYVAPRPRRAGAPSGDDAASPDADAGASG